MPLISHFSPQPGAAIAIWHITEPVAELESAFPVVQTGMFAKDTRNLHWLSSRLALHALLGDDFQKLDKHENGKPLLTDDHRYVSLTHAGDYAAAAVSISPIGIDLEQVLPRLARVQHKFVGVTERPFLVKMISRSCALPGVPKKVCLRFLAMRRWISVSSNVYAGKLLMAHKLLLDLPEVPDRENIWVNIKAVCPDMWLTYAIAEII